MNKKFLGSPVSQVDQIIQEAIASEASDIHFESFEKQFLVRFRIDGVLQKIADLQLAQRDAIISRIKVMANLDIAEKRRPQDGRIQVVSKRGTPVDIRVSTLPTEHAEKVVLRILDKSGVDLDVGKLGMDAEFLDTFRKAIARPYGMVLVTGPTGSGKSTTLYSALNAIKSDQININTIEDPIEYDLEGVNQTQVQAEIGLTFAFILRSILRQDPNVIMVGEIRDAETADIAIRAALTGHLVFSTLHTNDAPSAVARLTDMGVQPFLVASSVKLIVAQRLVRRICRECKQKHAPAEALRQELGLSASDILYKGEGCEVCNGTGYKGRVALFEILSVSPAISEAIAEGATTDQLRKLATVSGMTTLREQGTAKIRNGITTVEEVYRETVL